MPFLSSLRTPGTSPAGKPSAVDQSMLGGGLPVAAQSSQAPLEFENSILDDGSIRKLGPRRWASKPWPVLVPAASSKHTPETTNTQTLSSAVDAAR